MPKLQENHEDAGAVRIPNHVEEIWDSDLERHDHSARKFWTTRGTRKVHYWFFENEPFQTDPRLCLDAMKTTCKAYLNQFTNEKYECILFSVGISYRIEQCGSASHSKTMFDTWTLDQFDTNYSDAANFLTSNFYDMTSYAREPGTVEIGLLTLHCKTLSDHANKPRVHESDLKYINKKQRMKLLGNPGRIIRTEQEPSHHNQSPSPVETQIQQSSRLREMMANAFDSLFSYFSQRNPSA